MMHSHSPSPSRFPFTSSSNNSKAESIVKNFYIKAAQIIIQSRQQPQQVSEDADGKKRTNRWFNMDTREYPDSLRSELKFWITKAFLSPITQPPPLVIEVYLDVSNVPPGREVALQSGWRLVDLNAPVKKDRIVLEHWTLALNHPLPTEAIDLGSVYKRSILFFRTLYAFVRLLPAYAAYQRIMADTDDRHSLDIGYRLTNIANSKGDEIGLDEGPDASTATKSLDSIVTPLGTLGLQVRYRTNCNFVIHDPLAIDAEATYDSTSQLINLDHHYFKPTIANYTFNLSDDDPVNGITKTALKPTKKNLTDWPPVPHRSESARVTTAARAETERRHSIQHPSLSPTRRSTRPPSLSRQRPLSMYDGNALFTKSAEPAPSTSTRLHISPFKSATLSSSSQHSSTMSLRSAKGESEKSTKSNITRRFSSSFDYRHTDRYYHSAPSANCEMQSPLSTKTRSRRSYSLAKRPSNTTSSDQDEELEDFVRSFNLRQTPGFQSKMINEEESSDVIYGPSLDISASSFYRSKKALVHFQNLRGVHDSLSQSIISSTILPPLSSSLEQQQQQQQSITTASQATGVLSASKDQLPRASNSDISASSNSSLLSTSQSRGSPLGRLYQPRAPSPLHTEQSPLPTTGSIPVRIPERKHQHTDNNMADTTSSNEHHHDLYPPFMQRNKGFSDDDNNLSTPIKDTSQSSHEPHQQQKQLPKDMPKYRQFRRSTQLSINTESTSSSSGGFEREEDEQPNSAAAQDEDDDSLVFKMSELGIHEHHSK